MGVRAVHVGVIRERTATNMLPLHHESPFTFHFADARIIPASTWKASRSGGVSPSFGSTP